MSWALLVGSAAVLALGLASQLGWHADLHAITQPIPGAAPMQYNTALGFTLSGLAGVSVALGARRPGLAAGVLVLVLGVLTGLEHLFGLDLAIDEMVVQHTITDATSRPGLMAPATAAGFTMVGLGLVALASPGWRSWRWEVVALSASAVLVFGVASLLSYALGGDMAYDARGITEMAASTALAFVLLGAAVLHAAWRASPRRDGPPPWIALAAIVVSGGLVLSLWSFLRDHETVQMRARSRLALELVRDQIEQQIQHRALALVRMATRFTRAGGLPQHEWAADARLYVDHFSGFDRLQWESADGRQRWSVREPDATAALGGEGLPERTELARAIAEASRSGSPRLSRPWPVGGDAFFSLVAPAYARNGALEGWVIGTIHGSELLQQILRNVAPLYSVSVAGPAGVFWERRVDDGKGEVRRQGWEDEASLFGTDWRLDVWPSDSLLVASRSAVPGGWLATGLALSLTSGVAAHLALVSRRRSRQAERARAELENAQVELLPRERMAALGMIGAGVAHELNNPMTGILNQVDYVLERTQDPRSREVLESALVNTRRCVRIVQDLLTYVRGKSADETELADSDLHAAVHEAVRGVLPQCRDAGVRLTLRGEASGARVALGHHQVQQIVLNLVYNAIDAMEKSERRELTIELAREGPIGGVESAVIAVADTGAGMDPEHVARVLEPFFTTKPPGRGTGLGLSLCQNLVRGAGGSIEVSSRKGRGTRFHIRLPVRDTVTSPSRCAAMTPGAVAPVSGKEEPRCESS